MRLGVFTPSGNNGWIISKNSPQYMPTFELNLSVATRAEAFGFDFALAMVKFRGYGGETHHWDSTLDSLTLMAGLAAVTKRLTLYGTVSMPTLNPAIAARIVTTIDQIAPGRFGLNTVTGWNSVELSQMGLWPGEQYLSVRYDYAAEYIQVLRDLWDTGVSDFKGKYFTMEDCRLGPIPSARIPIISAAASATGRRFAAQHADFNFTDGDGVEGLEAAVKELADFTAQSGRVVKTIVHRPVILDDTDELAEKKVDRYNEGADTEALANAAGMVQVDKSGSRLAAITQRSETRQVVRGGLIGAPRTVADQINRIAQIEGVDGLLMSFDDYRDGFDRFGAEVVPLLDFQLASHS